MYFPPADYTPNLPVTVSITEGSAPAIGQSYTLTCLHTTAAGVSTIPVSFQWTGPDGNTVGTTNTLTLNPLSGDHRGEYSCLVTVGSGADTRVGCGVWLVGEFNIGMQVKWYPEEHVPKICLCVYTLHMHTL